MRRPKELKEEEIVERWSHLLEGAQGRGKEVFRSVKESIKDLNPPHVKLEEEMLTPELTMAGFLRAEKRKFLVASNDYLRGYKLCAGAKDYGNQLMISWYLIVEPCSILQLMLEWFIAHQNVSLGVVGIGLFFFLASKTALLPMIIWAIFLGYVIFRCFTSRESVLPQMLNIFDLEELTAYVTTVHHAVLAATKEVAESVGFDFTKVDQKSKGFLNIS
jgi:hypothetical protein